MEQLVDFFKDKNISKVLDVGTGPGHFIKVLQQAFPGARLTGVDPDQGSLEEARQNFPGVDFREMKGEQLDFPDDSFDVAAISMALHHLADIRKTLNEMQRVVKPGGWIVVNELYSDNLNPAQEVHKSMHHFRSKIDRMNGIVHNEAFPRQGILKKVEDSGLIVELYFDHKKPAEPPTPEDINERKGKLWTALETIKDRPEYHELASEIPNIEARLDQHGFEMATRLVVVARVSK